MDNYYIKCIWGPGAQEGYPYKENNSDNCLIYFSSKKGQKHFRECKGFLIYETGHKIKDKIGSKTIYAYGIIVFDQSNLSEKEDWKDYNGKKFPFPVRIRLQKRINPKDKPGVSLAKVRKIIKRKNIQQAHGLIKITKEQFKKLRSYL